MPLHARSVFKFHCIHHAVGACFISIVAPNRDYTSNPHSVGALPIKILNTHTVQHRYTPITKNIEGYTLLTLDIFPKMLV